MSIVSLVGGSPVGLNSTNIQAVKAIEAALGIPPSGQYDEDVVDAVTKFQHDHNLGAEGLTVYGVVGHITALAMDAIAAAPASPTPPKLVITTTLNAEPVWNRQARSQIGIHEVGDNSGPDVARYIAGAHAGAPGEPWCAIFANWALESCGIRGTRSASSQSFRNDPNFVKLDGPAFGALVVYWRSPRAQGVGHVGFYQKENATSIYTLGGNESDMVKEEWLPKAASSFGLEGYYWPKSIPLPKIGPITVNAAAPLATVKVT